MRAVPKTRAYDSPRRREQAAATRALILAAARPLFENEGYAATPMATIAQQAGVTPKTVFNVFETKAGLLRAVWNRALRGANDEIPIQQQRRFREILEETDPARALRLNARNSRRFNEQSTALLEVLRDAAPLDPEIAALWNRIQNEYHANQQAVVESLGKGALRPRLSVRRAADILWTLNHPNTWIQLGAMRGWSPAQYERWVADTSCEQLLGRRAT